MLQPNVNDLLDRIVGEIRAESAADDSIDPRVKALIADAEDFEIKALAWQAAQHITQKELLADSSAALTLIGQSLALASLRLQLDN